MTKNLSNQDECTNKTRQSGTTLSKKVEKTIEKTKGRARRKSYVMDLRVHSPGSLGYYGISGIETAPALISLAKVKGLDVIAVTDFYSGSFIDEVVEAAKESSVTVIPGVDIRCTVGTCDDVILTCLFREEFSSAVVDAFLKEIGIPETAIGDRQYLVGKQFEDILNILERFDAVALPSRIDKTPYRMTALSALVEQYGFRAFDLAYAESVELFKKRWPDIKFNLFTFSNANSLAQVGSRTAKVKMPNAGFDSIRELVERCDMAIM